MVCSGQLLLVKPAPTVEISNIYARVFPWVGAGLRDGLFGAIIVGETRPYGLIDSATGFALSATRRSVLFMLLSLN